MIREIENKDKEIFISMVKEFYQSKAVLHSIPTDNMINTYNEIMADSAYTKAYIMEDNKDVVGYCLISLTYSNEVGGLVVWIEELYIKDEFRGMGYGSEFLEFIKEKFADQAKRFRLEVSNDNKSAQSLYLHKGYVPLEYMQMVCDR